MTPQLVSPDIAALINEVSAHLTVSSPELLAVPWETTEVVARAGLQSSVGTITFAGQHALATSRCSTTARTAASPRPGRDGPSSWPRTRCSRRDHVEDRVQQPP